MPQKKKLADDFADCRMPERQEIPLTNPDIIKRLPKDLTPKQRQPSAGQPLLQRGQVVVFRLQQPGFADQVGVIVRTPTDPGGMTGLYEVIPLAGFLVGQPQFLCTLFDMTLYRVGTSPPVAVLIPQGNVVETLELPDALTEADYISESRRVQEHRAKTFLMGS